MRHIDRMRAGMALAAALFCLTSATTPWSAARPVRSATAAASEAAETSPPATLAGVAPIVWSDTGAVGWFAHLGDSQPVRVWRRGESHQLRPMLQALAAAPLTQPSSSRFSGALVLYKRNGEASHTLYLTEDGRVYEPVSQSYFLAPVEVLQRLR
ncbi:MAG: hypothetical protein K6T26_00270 [Alicyclobacillus sp.]|nr:hypothetical protein [Alicyclobacillus sp.]